MNDPASAPDPWQDMVPDPLFTGCLREGKWILLMWASCFAWTLTVGLKLGYPTQIDPDSFPMVMGLPAWVAWGILFPWMATNIVTIWFCLCYMEDADLGAEPYAGNANSAADVATTSQTESPTHV